MQATLCAIFFASVGLAELLTRQHQGATGMARAEPISFHRAGLHGVIRLPAEWVVKKKDIAGPRVLVAQVPDTPEHRGATLSCLVEQLPAVIPPMEFLQASDILDLNTRIVTTNGGNGLEPVTMGSVTGVMLQIIRETDAGSENQWIACCVLPSGHAVTLIMDCQPGDPEADRQTMHDLASSMEFKILQ
jgi:hypothetical protein